MTITKEQTGSMLSKASSLSKSLMGGQVISMDRASYNQGQNAKDIVTFGHDERSSQMTAEGITDPLTSSDYKQPITVAYAETYPGVRYIVRRLTPNECEALQGFPQNWTNIGDWTDSKGKKHKGDADAPRYKALGNSIALPQWAWVIERMCKHLPQGATMASLFDGIGGFPLIWERINGKGSCLWASEIEEFPMAVTKLHFSGDVNEEQQQ